MPTAPDDGGDGNEGCLDLLARHDEDLFLSLRYALPGDRERLAALFALQAELRRVPHLVSEPQLGEIRLQWWREAVANVAAGGGGRGHPVVGALKASGAVTTRAAALIERMIEARARMLYAPEFSSLEDLADYLAEAEAPLAALAAGDDADCPEEELIAAGKAYALARFAPSLAPGFADAAAGESRRMRRLSSLHQRSLSPRLIGAVAFLALARGYSARPGGGRWPAAKRIALLKAVLGGRL